MKTKLFACAIAAIMWYGCDDKDDETTEINIDDRNFVTMASMANKAEIEAGLLASAKATNDGIMEFGEMMLSDHGESKSELANLAYSMKLSAPNSLDPDHVALKAKLMAISGREFDSVYIHSQVKDHEKTISLFNTEIQGGDNQLLKNYASKQLPHLQLHLQKAESLASAY